MGGVSAFRREKDEVNFLAEPFPCQLAGRFQVRQGRSFKIMDRSLRARHSSSRGRLAGRSVSVISGKASFVMKERIERLQGTSVITQSPGGSCCG